MINAAAGEVRGTPDEDRVKCAKELGKFLSDNKSVCSTGRLTNKAINTLQNYCGMVIPSNIGNLYQMKKGVTAVVCQCTEYLNAEGKPDNNARHVYCPHGENPWYKYQKYCFTKILNRM